MTLVIRKRGRPRKEEVLARYKPVVVRTDAEILSDLTERFEILGVLTKGTIARNVRAVTVTGAPGVGKTYTVEKILDYCKEKQGTQFEIVRGALSAVNLYKLAYRNRKPGNVIVLDDADSIFNDEDALNLLKVLCDSSETRKVSWMKESNALTSEDIPQRFEFNGAIIFVSNVNFQSVVDTGSNKYAAHMAALMSRSLYLDLQIHDRHSIGLWVEYIATAGKLFEREGINSSMAADILLFIKEYRDDLRELSVRTTVKLCQLAKTHPTEWKRMGRVLLCR